MDGPLAKYPKTHWLM